MTPVNIGGYFVQAVVEPEKLFSYMTRSHLKTKKTWRPHLPYTVLKECSYIFTLQFLFVFFDSAAIQGI